MFLSPASRQSRRRAYSSLNLLDSISSSFNGSTTTFNLTLNGAAISPISANYLEVVLGGVQQQPGASYTISGSQITFSSAPSTVDSCFIIWMQTTGLLASSGGGGGTASVAGANTQLQFNNSGALGADANLTWITGASALLTIGNSTVNTAISGATGLDVGNTTVNTSINSTMVTIGTIGTTIGSWITNTQISVGNSTVNGYLNQIPALYLGAINSTAIGTMINSISHNIGNSSINATMNASTLSTSGPNFTVISTTTTAIPLTVKGAASATANLFAVGNNTTASQFVINSTGYAIGNGAGLTTILSANGLNAGLTTKSFDVLSPIAGDTYTVFWTNAAITIAEIVVVLSNTGATAWANLGWFSGTSRITVAATINATANVANNTNGLHITGFTTAAVAANSYVWCNVGGLSNATEIFCCIKY